MGLYEQQTPGQPAFERSNRDRVKTERVDLDGNRLLSETVSGIGSELFRVPPATRVSASEPKNPEESNFFPAEVTLKSVLALMAERQRELDAQHTWEQRPRERQEMDRIPKLLNPELQSHAERAERQVRNPPDEVSLNIGSIVVRIDPEPVSPPRPSPPSPQAKAYSAPETSNGWARSFLDR